MKKIVTILVLVFAFTLTTEAQRNEKNNNVETMLAKMTTDLELTEQQQNKIKPLLVAQSEERKLMAKTRKEQRDSGERPSKEEREMMRKDRAAKEANFISKLSSILDEKQLEKYKALAEELKKNRRGGGQRRN